jgi:expansin
MQKGIWLGWVGVVVGAACLMSLTSSCGSDSSFGSGGAGSSGTGSSGNAGSAGRTQSSAGGSGATAGNGGNQSAGNSGSSSSNFGEKHQGEYHLGPVEWTGSFNNACSPYPESIAALEGGMLVGLSGEIAGKGDYCDACIQITTDLGKSVVARVVTYGVTSAPGNIDLSQAAYDAIHQNEFPRLMTWQLVSCSTTEPMYFQFQTGAHEDWTSFWVRNPNKAVDKVEVKSAKHTDFFLLRREVDGTLNDDAGFGTGPFTLRISSNDGQSVEQSFPGFKGGDLLKGNNNFQ